MIAIPTRASSDSLLLEGANLLVQGTQKPHELCVKVVVSVACQQVNIADKLICSWFGKQQTNRLGRNLSGHSVKETGTFGPYRQPSVPGIVKV